MASIHGLKARLEKLEAAQPAPSEETTLLRSFVSADGNGGRAPGQEEVHYLKANRDGRDEVFKREPSESEAAFIDQVKRMTLANERGLRFICGWSIADEDLAAL